MVVRGQNSGGGGELDVGNYVEVTVNGGSYVDIPAQDGDYIYITVYRSTSGVNVYWNGVTSHTSPLLYTRLTNLATNQFGMVFKGSSQNRLSIDSGANLKGGYSVVKLA